jgi:hypothetical protein
MPQGPILRLGAHYRPPGGLASKIGCVHASAFDGGMVGCSFRNANQVPIQGPKIKLA